MTHQLHYTSQHDARQDCDILGISPEQLHTMSRRFVAGHGVEGQPLYKTIVASLDVDRELFSRHWRELHHIS